MKIHNYTAWAKFRRFFSVKAGGGTYVLTLCNNGLTIFFFELSEIKAIGLFLFISNYETISSTFDISLGSVSTYRMPSTYTGQQNYAATQPCLGWL
jgi:hypothetical protein